jgi:hypothetical protein
MRLSYYNDTYEQQLEILEEASINTRGCIRARYLYDFSAHFSDGVSESDKSVEITAKMASLGRMGIYYGGWDTMVIVMCLDLGCKGFWSNSSMYLA